jgi:hypothetical protein
MTVQIKQDWWFQIENELFFWYTYVHNSLINLASEMWEDMRYNEGEATVIDYPGEYDVKGWSIKVLRWMNWKLNYLIQKWNKKIWIIQSPDVLELQEVDWMDTWLYQGEAIEKKFDQLEIEWEKINLETFWQEEPEE